MNSFTKFWKLQTFLNFDNKQSQFSFDLFSESGCSSRSAIASPPKATANEKPSVRCNVKFTGAQSIEFTRSANAHVADGRQPNNTAKPERQPKCRRHFDAVNAKLRYAYAPDAKAFDRAASARTVARRTGRSRGARTIRQNIQATAHQIRFHPRWRWPGHGQVVRQWFLTNDHFEVWGIEFELQKYVQTEATAAEMARGCGQ